MAKKKLNHHLCTIIQVKCFHEPENTHGLSCNDMYSDVFPLLYIMSIYIHLFDSHIFSFVSVGRKMDIINPISNPTLSSPPVEPPAEVNIQLSQPYEIGLSVDENTLLTEWQPSEEVLEDWRADYDQLLDDIKQQEAEDDDPFEEKQLTPLQKNCSICRHNNMLRHMSCHSGQVQCHVCCMDLMNCMCYHDSEGMVDEAISQDFTGHILTV